MFVKTRQIAGSDIKSKRVASKLQLETLLDCTSIMGNTSSGRTGAPRAKINTHASGELTAWANALHVSEQELADAVEKLGDDAREVITYFLKRPDWRRTRRTTPR